jgi:K+-transporting ATPase ATPase B chain
MDGRSIRKGAVDAMLAQTGQTIEHAPAVFRQAVDSIARTGGTPLAVAEGSDLVGVVRLFPELARHTHERPDATASSSA